MKKRPLIREFRYKLLKVRYCVLEKVKTFFCCQLLDDLNLNS